MTQAYPNPVMTVKQVSDYLQVSESKIYQLAKTNEIPCRKIGGTWRFYRKSVDAWLMGQLTPPATDAS